MQTPHDRFFRRIFSDPEHASGELRALLPPALAARLDWSSLRLLPATFVDPELSELRADLLFSASIEGREALLYLLMEHQSSPDPFMPLCLLGYLVRIWEAWRREHPHAARLPAVVPLVMHHSDKGWSSPIAFEALLDLEGELLEALRPHLPLFAFLLDDLSVARDDELRARAMSTLGRLALWCLKRARGGDDLSDELARWGEAMVEIARAPNGVSALAAVLSYLLEVSDTPPERLRALTRVLGPAVEEAYMTGGQLLIEQGRREGEAKGRAEGLREGEAKGEAKGLREGEARGEAKGKAAALLAVLGARGLAVDAATRARVEGCADVARLDRWLARALTAGAAREALDDDEVR